jgi:hypothetical protein
MDPYMAGAGLSPIGEETMGEKTVADRTIAVREAACAKHGDAQTNTPLLDAPGLLMRNFCLGERIHGIGIPVSRMAMVDLAAPGGQEKRRLRTTRQAGAGSVGPKFFAAFNIHLTNGSLLNLP